MINSALQPTEFTGSQLSAPESEEQLLSVLLDGHDAWLPALQRTLRTPEVFVDPERRRIWQLLLEMHTRGEVITMDSVAVILRRESGVEGVRSLGLLIGRHGILNYDMAEWHARQLAHAHGRRLLAEAAEMAQKADAGPQEMAAVLRQSLQKMEHIAYTTGEDAPRPLPLATALPPVQAFDPDWLPDAFRPWITDIAERMQCPPEFPAVAAMTALSSVAGRRFCIQPKMHDDGYTEFPHLWGMLIGNPSLMKSPAMQAAMRPLNALVADAQRNYSEQEQARRTAEIETRMRRSALESAAKKAAKNGEAFDFSQLIHLEDEEGTPLRRLIVNNPSLEALGEVLKENPTGTLLYQDELAGLLALLEKDGNQSLRAFLLQAWSGKEGFTFDRIGRGRRHIEACALSVLGSIQPGVIASHVRAASGHTAGADGFLQRFSLMVWPDVNPQWQDIDRALDRDAQWEAERVFTWVENVTPKSLNTQHGIELGYDGMPTYRFSPHAQPLFTEWRGRFEQRLRSSRMAAPFEAHLGKYRKLVPALALLIHVADECGGPVSLRALERALAWAGCLETHAARVFASATIAETDAVHTLLKKLCDGTSGLPEEFKARDIKHKGWAGLNSHGDVEAACELLSDHRWLIVTPQPPSAQGGRPTKTYRLNPLARHASHDVT
jgi:Protein of unknown function (DUF3987)/DnaB-like helicase N terminal domain